MGVMAKAPQPGRAKTRLCPPLEPVQAAELSAAFLRDITENIALASRAVPIDGYIAYAPGGNEGWFAGHLAEGTALVLADGSPPMPHDVQGFGDACCTLRRLCSQPGSVPSPGELRQPDPADCSADPGGARAAGAG